MYAGGNINLNLFYGVSCVTLTFDDREMIISFRYIFLRCIAYTYVYLMWFPKEYVRHHIVFSSYAIASKWETWKNVLSVISLILRQNSMIGAKRNTIPRIIFVMQKEWNTSGDNGGFCRKSSDLFPLRNTITSRRVYRDPIVSDCVTSRNVVTIYNSKRHDLCYRYHFTFSSLLPFFVVETNFWNNILFIFGHVLQKLRTWDSLITIIVLIMLTL